MKKVSPAVLALWVLVGCTAVPSEREAGAQPLQVGPAPDRAGAAASLSAAIKQQDYRRAIAIQDDWAKRHPADLEFRRFEPVLHRLAGDRAGWEAARGDLLATWRRVRATVPPPNPPSFIVDFIRVGQDTIVADQCYERAGRFGVIYRFSVTSPDGRIRSFFTVESPDSDNQIARELGSTQPVFTLDHFMPGGHETVAMLPGLPPYEELRERVLAYMAHPQPLSASRNGGTGLSSENCSVNPRDPMR